MRRGLIALMFTTVLFSSCRQEVDIPGDVLAAEAMLPEKIDYNLHIKPILSDRCFKCHGPDISKVEAGLQLVSLETATQQLESGAKAIAPGNPYQSELVRRILSDDPEVMMPPPESHLNLSTEEKAMLIRWIDEGAQFKKHWSLATVVKPDIPRAGKSWLARWGITDDEETAWIQNGIDNFVLKKLKERKLSFSREADPATLLRRVHMDLTGLPPSPGEVDDFLRDPSAAAYEKVVDRLLASPHFGEHQAATWLDLARYADTHGYQDDGMRNAYPYRDWVIKAFNENLSFDKFIAYQLAGDLLPEAGQDQIVATSFNRQHPQSQEGGIVADEYLNEYVADRTNTFGKGFLGLTMECARCHDHKYDPISTRDYYSLYAFFNQNREYGQVPYSGEASPTFLLPDAETENKLRYIREKIQAVTAEMDGANSARETRFEHFRQNVADNPVDAAILKEGLLVHVNFETMKDNSFTTGAQPDYTCGLSGDHDRKPVPVPGKRGNGIRMLGDCGLHILSKADREANSAAERHYKGLNFERNQPFSFSFWVNVPEKGISGPLITKNNGEFEGYRGYDLFLNKDHTLTFRMMYVYPANGIEIITRDPVRSGAWIHLAFTYDGSSRATGCRLFIDGKPATVRVLTDNLIKSILYDNAGQNWSFMPFEIGKNFLTTIENVSFDELRIYKRRLSFIEVRALSSDADQVSLQDTDENLLEFYRWNRDSVFRKDLERVTDLRLEEVKTITPVEEVMVMKELPADQQRKTYIYERGVYDSPTDEVHAETPVVLGKLPEGLPRNRLGLAQWLLHPDNPLFARVIVNRFWMQFFGTGLVRTQEDFGNQGELPSHPELLDWLSATFREDNWNTKVFLKRIVMSATYRQSSVATAALLEMDPGNRWLSRGPSHPFSAEQVRDNALAASGLLVRRIGGPSVYPYQPGGIWEALATRNAVRYEQQHGDSLYRRSLYTVWKRSSPPPMMLNFDAADRQTCTVRRQKTATPLQSLVTMNDPQFVEAARVLAERTIVAFGNTDERIHHLFKCIISRYPRKEELAIIRDLLLEQEEYYTGNPALAEAMRNAGEYPAQENLNSAAVAAYTIAANTLLNYDEALVKR